MTVSGNHGNSNPSCMSHTLRRSHLPSSHQKGHFYSQKTNFSHRKINAELFFHKFIAYEACIKHVPSPESMPSTPFSATIEIKKEMADFVEGVSQRKVCWFQFVKEQKTRPARQRRSQTLKATGSHQTTGRGGEVYPTPKPQREGPCARFTPAWTFDSIITHASGCGWRRGSQFVSAKKICC